MILGYAIIQLPEMIILLIGFIKNWRFYMRQKWSGMQQMQNNTNALQDSNADRIMVQIKPQKDENEWRMKKENYEGITNTLEKIESRLKEMERNMEFGQKNP